MAAEPAPLRSPVGEFVQLAPIARTSVVDAVFIQIQRELLAGRLAAGGRLPPERELAATLGVNRLTLRAALGRLEAQGFLTTKHGSGTLVTVWQEHAGLDALAHCLAAVTPGPERSSEGRFEAPFVALVASLLEIRRVLVAESVALAAARHTVDDLKGLRALALAQKGRAHDLAAFARGEVAFQRALIRAGGNIGFELMLNTFARVAVEQPNLVALLYDRIDISVGFYDAIFELLASRDADAVRASVRGVLEAIDEAWAVRHGIALQVSPPAPSPPREDTSVREAGDGAEFVASASPSLRGKKRRESPENGESQSKKRPKESRKS
jgi:GntR family transcriptional repressor for pyruvate dehydrogenase complex